MTDILGFLAKTDSLAWALVGVGVLFIITGLLVPRYLYKEKAREAERWRQAYELEREARTAAVEQTSDLLEMARTNNAIQSALFDSSRSQTRGDTRVVSTNQGD